MLPIVGRTGSGTVAIMDERISLTGRRWAFTDEGGLPEAAESLDELLGHFLMHRAIDDTPHAEGLLGTDARTFRDYKKAAARIRTAIDTKETVAIFGDYDCDGITGAAILTRFFRRHGLQPLVRLPHRLKEGYGLRRTHIEEFAKKSVTLLVTVDTGVTAKECVSEGKILGIDTVILDHHSLPKDLPEAEAILHPSIRIPGASDDSSPCGAGVAWSFVEAFERASGTPQWHEREIDLVFAAIGTVADVMELRGGNRALVRAGLKALQTTDKGTLALLCLQSGITPPYTSRDIGFRLAPRINAAGRMADPHIALHALLGDPQALLELETLNRQRQDLVGTLMGNVEEHASLGDRFICILEESCTPGVCGLMAGKICEQTGRPTLVAALENGRCTASLRGVPSYDVTAALRRAEHLLTDFGGHAMAAGCSFNAGIFDALRAFLIADASERIPESEAVPLVVIDVALDPRHITPELCAGLDRLEPFGQGNHEPRFLLQNVMLSDIRTVGSDKKHLQAKIGNAALIGFGHGELIRHLRQPVDIVCRIGMNTWKGFRRVQIQLDDVRVASPAHVAVIG